MNTRFSNIPAMRMFALAGTNTLEGPELEALMDQVDKEMNLDGKDVSRFATADNHLDKMTIRNGGKNMTPQQKKVKPLLLRLLNMTDLVKKRRPCRL